MQRALEAISGTLVLAAGTWSGRVLVFDIPAKGPNIVLSEELAGHQTPITDIATERAQGQVSSLAPAVLVAWETSSPSGGPGVGISYATKQKCGFVHLYFLRCSNLRSGEEHTFR